MLTIIPDSYLLSIVKNRGISKKSELPSAQIFYINLNRKAHPKPNALKNLLT